MKLKKWALIAEVVSGAAILVTLVLLVLEVRTNTDVARIAAYQAVTRDFDDFRSMLLNDPELLKLVGNANVSGQYSVPIDDPLAPVRLGLMLDSQFSGSERAFLSYRAGIIGDQEWARISRAVCSEFARVPERMQELRAFRLTDDFVAYLRSECEF